MLDIAGSLGDLSLHGGTASDQSGGPSGRGVRRTPLRGRCGAPRELGAAARPRQGADEPEPVEPPRQHDAADETARAEAAPHARGMFRVCVCV